MPNKNLDGIQKISGQELERARKIVLESIGEKDGRFGKEDSSKPVQKRGRAMDSLSVAGPAAPIKKPAKKTEAKSILAKNDLTFQNSRPLKMASSFPVKKSGAFKAEKIIEQEAMIAEEKRKKELKEKILRQAQDKDKEIAKFALEEENRKKAEEAKKIAEQEAKKAEEKRQAEKKEKELKEKADKEAKRIALEKENKKKKEKAKKEKRIKKEIRRELRIMRWGKFKDNIKRNWRNSLKIFLFSALFLGIAMIIFYLVFCLLLLKFNLNNKISRQLSEYIPVPAAVAKEGWVEYYNYKKITAGLEKQYQNQQELQRVKKNRIINQIALDGLVKRYGLNLKNKTNEEILKEINLSLAADKEKNAVSISRIAKIKELIARSSETMMAGGQAESFEEIGKKYSDEQGYLANGQEDSRFSNFLGRLAVGETSEVLVSDDGYYMFKRDARGFNYIFVKSITFSKYLENLVQEMKVWVLAD